MIVSRKYLAMVIMLLAGVMAAPASTNVELNSTSVIIPRKAYANDCGPSTFNDASSPGSTLVSDSQNLAANVISPSDTYVAWRGTNIIGQSGTCAFAITGNSKIRVGSVGGQNIIDIINSSIDQFQWVGLVGAEGGMSWQLG